MDLAAIHWQHVPLALGVLAAIVTATFLVLELALSRRASWAARSGDQSQYRNTMPVERRKAARPRRSAWPRPAMS